MVVYPVYQTKFVRVEMTQQEVDRLTALYTAVDTLHDGWRYLVEDTPVINAIWKARKNAPEIIKGEIEKREV